MKMVSDRFNNTIFISDIEDNHFPSVAVVAPKCSHLEEEHLQDLIQDLQEKLKTMKGEK